MTDPADRLAEIKHWLDHGDPPTVKSMRWLIAEVERNRVEIAGRKGERSDLISIIEQQTAEVERLRVAAGILQKLCDNYDIDTRGPHCFIGIDGDGIFITLDANEVAFLAALTDGTEATNG